MELDILLLTVYFICIGYLIYQMALSVEADLEDQVMLIPDPDILATSLKDQLIRQGVAPDIGEVVAAAPAPLKPAMGLKLTLPSPRSVAPQSPATDGLMVVQVLPQGPQPIQPIPGLTVQVLNQTQSLQVAVDWDRSSLTQTTNQARRVIRHTPGMRLDLAMPQVVSVVNPNQVLSAVVTSEDSFSRDPNTQVMEIAKPWVDLNRLLGEKPAARFYALDLVLQITPLTGRGARPLVLLLPFRFRVERLAAKASIPYINWMLKR